MPGNGTRPDSTTAEASPPARLLDITRLLSRAGRVLTGIDRVELAYLDRLASESVPCFGLARTRLGFVLIGPEDLRAVGLRLTGQGNLPAPDLLSRLGRGKTRAQRAAETDLRRTARARCLRRGLARMLKRHLPDGFAYLNVGHSNLGSLVLDGVRDAGGRIAVLIHDVIPLEFPEFQKPGTPARFEAMLRRIRSRADLVIYNSQDTRTRSEGFLRGWGDVPPGIVALLGTTPPQPKPGELPDTLPPQQPYFVTIGTIEPRKNHAFLLDLWEQMAPGAPQLVICGSRGWRNEAVFARLDALDTAGPIHVFSGLSDGAIAALVAGAAGVLFPSFAEGYGYPAVEAAMLGTPVIVNDLGVYQEILDNIPIYASVADGYLWIKHIEALAEQPVKDRTKADLDHLSWDMHFKVVLRLT